MSMKERLTGLGISLLIVASAAVLPVFILMLTYSCGRRAGVAETERRLGQCRPGFLQHTICVRTSSGIVTYDVTVSSGLPRRFLEWDERP